MLAADSPASSALTRELLGWQPDQPGLIEDLDQGHYFDRYQRMTTGVLLTPDRGATNVVAATVEQARAVYDAGVRQVWLGQQLDLRRHCARRGDRHGGARAWRWEHRCCRSIRAIH